MLPSIASDVCPGIGIFCLNTALSLPLQPDFREGFACFLGNYFLDFRIFAFFFIMADTYCFEQFAFLAISVLLMSFRRSRL
jgi:hypothetical protein